MTWDADITIELDAEVSYNCACDDDWSFETLSALRTKIMRRLGFSAQAANPPPGMAELIDDILQDAQKQLYGMFREKRMGRFFEWTMTPGVRYYGIRSNDDTCAVNLDPRTVQWVGIQDLNDVWYEIYQGIDPALYTRAETYNGWPSRYEIRSCIEVFPAPREAYKLRVKGLYELQSFTEDTDTTSIDSHMVYLLALGLAKQHYGRRDAESQMAQANQYLLQFVADQHRTARYIPSPDEGRVAQTPPRMQEFLE